MSAHKYQQLYRDMICFQTFLILLSRWSLSSIEYILVLKNKQEGFKFPVLLKHYLHCDKIIEDFLCCGWGMIREPVQHTFFLVLKVNFPPVSSKLLVRNQPRSTWSLRNTHHFLCEQFFSEHHLRAESKLSTNTGGQPVVVLIGNRTLKLWF